MVTVKFSSNSKPLTLLLLLLLSSTALADRVPASLVRVIDGDTIVVRLKGSKSTERVRLIGIDCPEAKAGRRLERQVKQLKTSEQNFLKLAQAGTAYAKLALSQGELELEFDVQKRDRYQRLLAYVWVGERHLNLELVEQGLATVYTVPPNVQYQDQFLEAQRRARSKKKGMWK